MAQLLEDIYPPIQSAGLNTNKAVAFGSTLAVTGNTSVTGNLAVTGTSTLTGAVSFATAPTFTGGRTVNVVNVNFTTGTTATLTLSQSGSTVFVDSTQGSLITLPATLSGAEYVFVYLKAPTIGSHKVITSAGSVYLTGALVTGTAGVGTIATFVANTGEHVAVTMNGTTTGGSQGTVFKTTCVSSTQWAVSGQCVGSGAIATPFATS